MKRIIFNNKSLSGITVLFSNIESQYIKYKSTARLQTGKKKNFFALYPLEKYGFVYEGGNLSSISKPFERYRVAQPGLELAEQNKFA